MKRTLNVNIGKMPFTIDEDAFQALDGYYSDIRARLFEAEKQEVMDDVEARTADIFRDNISYPAQVVDIFLVRKAMGIIGSPDSFGETRYDIPSGESDYSYARPKKLYRSRTDRYLGGVCGGMADYFGMDSTIVRILLLVFVLLGGAGVILYLILWIVIPEEPIENVLHGYRNRKKAYRDDYYSRKDGRR